MIEPALSAEEWAKKESDAYIDDEGKLWLRSECGGEPYAEDYEPTSRHALAALCLHGQPFGFTWGDVRLLRYWEENVSADNAPRRAAILNLADRIAALLPPRAP